MPWTRGCRLSLKWHTSFSDAACLSGSLPAIAQNQETKLATKSRWPPARAFAQTKQNTQGANRVSQRATRAACSAPGARKRGSPVLPPTLLRIALLLTSKRGGSCTCRCALTHNSPLALPVAETVASAHAPVQPSRNGSVECAEKDGAGGPMCRTLFFSRFPF